MGQTFLFGAPGAPTVRCPLGCEAPPRPSRRGHVCADCGVEFSTLDAREKEGGEPCQAQPPAESSADEAPVPRGSTRQDTPRPEMRQAVPTDRPAGPTTCPRCGSADLITAARGDQHQAELRCRGCGRWLRFLGAPWTRKRAAAFVMPFGKHKGRTLGDLAESEPDYLRWVAGEVRGTPARAARILLGLEPAEVRP